MTLLFLQKIQSIEPFPFDNPYKDETRTVFPDQVQHNQSEQQYQRHPETLVHTDHISFPNPLQTLNCIHSTKTEHV